MAAWSFGFLQTHVRGGTVGLELRHSQPVGILHISVENLSRIGGRTCDSSAPSGSWGLEARQYTQPA